MAFGEAKRRPTFGRRIMQSKREERNLYNLVRRLEQPRATSIVFFAGRGADIQGQNASGFLRTSGDTMMGPIAFFPALVTISAGIIDIGELTDAFSSRVIVTPESGSTDDLVTISNAKHNGQLLFLQGVQTDTITLKTTGNIETIDGNDFDIVDDDIIILQFDVTDNKWQQVTTGKQFLTGGNEFVDNLFRIFDDIDGTRKLAFQTGGISTLTTRTVTIQDADGTMMLIDGTGTQIVVKPTEIRDSIFSIVDDIDGTRKLAFQTGGIAASTTRIWTAQNASGTVPLLDGSAGTQIFSNAIQLNGVTLDMNGNDLILDADADSKFVTSVDDVLTLNLLGSARFVWTTTSYDISDKFTNMSEIVTPANPAANNLRTYAVDDSGITKLAYLDSAGTETIVGVGGNEFQDNLFRIFDDIDNTRKLAFQTGGIAASTTRTWTAQNASGTVALLDSGLTQVFSDNIDMNSNTISEVGLLSFNPTTFNFSINDVGGGSIDLNLPAARNFRVILAGTQRFTVLSSGAVDLRNSGIQGALALFFQAAAPSNSISLNRVGTDLLPELDFNGPTGTNYDFRINTVSLFQIGPTNIDVNANLDISTKNILTDTTTGTKIGTSTSQKIGFYNSTPVIQQTVASDTLANLYTALRAVGIIG